MEQTKKCTKCNNILPLSLFRTDNRLKSGIGAACKKCNAAIATDWRLKNQARAKEAYKRWSQTNKEYLSARKMKWAKDNPESKKESDKKYAEKNKQKRIEQSRLYREENKEIVKQKNKAWRKENHAYILSKNRERYAVQKNRLPSWVNEDELLEIKKVYAECKARRDNGEDCHVDHIIPFRGETVSGFHVLNNLRIVPATENLSKKNKFSDWDLRTVAPEVED